MLKYVTSIKEDYIKLSLMNREKVFRNGQEVFEDIYVKAYPQYFKRIGEVRGLNIMLATPTFVPILQSQIDDFITKENIRRKETKLKEVDINEISEDIPEIKIETEEEF